MSIRPMAALLALSAAAVVSLAGCATPAQPAGLTAAEIDAILADVDDVRWSALMRGWDDVEQPEVAREGFVRQVDAPHVWVACLHDGGFAEAAELGTSVYLGGYRGERDRDARLAFFTCTAQYPIHPAYNGHLAASQRAYLFDYWERRLIPCLRRLGYQIEVPETLRFARFSTDWVGPWSPYDGIDPGDAGWAAIDASCPPLPADTYGSWRP